MSSTTSSHPGTRAIRAILEALEDAGITATRDAGAFYPQPTGVLVGLPELVSRTLAGRVFNVTVSVVSGDPLNSELAVDRLLALADDVALTLSAATYRPSSYRGGVNSEPMPAYELVVSATVPEEEESSHAPD
jgi:hypothetical protein